MKIAVLSGKGGTGKTFVSVNLAIINKNASYIDCDVEEPNGYLFLKPKIIDEEIISVKIPKINNNLCNGCRKCVEFCKFNALAYIYNRIVIFKEICHSCGGCSLICPNKAFEDEEHEIGMIKIGENYNINILSGILNIGEVSGIPLVNKLLDKSNGLEGNVIIDCPPGSSCSVLECVKAADYCIIVTEPTIFGLHNFKMVYNLVKLFNKPMGVIINKNVTGYNPMEVYCLKNNINILIKLPFDDKLGLLNSQAKIAALKDNKYKLIFQNLNNIIIEEMNL